jgi:hypothetical protein
LKYIIKYLIKAFLGLQSPATPYAYQLTQSKADPKVEKHCTGVDGAVLKCGVQSSAELQGRVPVGLDGV